MASTDRIRTPAAVRAPAPHRRVRGYLAFIWIGILPAARPADLGAQVRASERGTVSQTVDGTVIEVDYGRPRLKGRVPFGGVVHWGEVWTPGANFATTLRVTKPVRIASQPLAAGRYSVWIVPAEQGPWVVGLHRNPRLYHLERPKPADFLLRLEVRPDSLPPVEHLTFSFPIVRRDGAVLRFQWGTTGLDLDIVVPATSASRPRLDRREVAAYLGEYRAWVFAEHGDSVPLHHRLIFADGRLRGVRDEGGLSFELVPAGRPHQFYFEWQDALGPMDQELARPVTFLFDRNGTVTEYRMPGIEQPLWIRAVKEGAAPPPRRPR